MKDNVVRWVRIQPVKAFYILAFIITWLGWMPQAAHSHGLFPFNSPIFYVFGGVGPLAAALIVARVLYGKKDSEEVFGPLLRWRVGIIWYIVAMCGSVVIMLASAGFSGELQLGIGRLTPSTGLLMTFLTYLVAAIPEEVAWRGFVLPRLQARYSALVSSLIIGVLWALWHIPLLLIKDSVMSTYPLLPYFVGTIAASVVYTWLFNSCEGSALIVTIFHAISNTIGPNFGFEQMAIEVVLAVVILMAYGTKHISAARKRIVRNSTEGIQEFL